MGFLVSFWRPKRAATTDSPLFNAVRRRNLTTENSTIDYCRISNELPIDFVSFWSGHQSIVDLFDTKSPVAQKLQEGSNTLKSDATSHAAKDKAVQKLQQGYTLISQQIFYFPIFSHSNLILFCFVQSTACDYYSSDDLMFNIQNGELANATEFPWMVKSTANTHIRSVINQYLFISFSQRLG